MKLSVNPILFDSPFVLKFVKERPIYMSFMDCWLSIEVHVFVLCGIKYSSNRLATIVSRFSDRFLLQMPTGPSFFNQNIWQIFIEPICSLVLSVYCKLGFSYSPCSLFYSPWQEIKRRKPMARRVGRTGGYAPMKRSSLAFASF